MDEEKTPPVTAFDQMLAQNQMQVIKAAVPYLSAPAQKAMAICIKLMELQHTVNLFSSVPEVSAMSSHANVPFSPCEMLEDISQYASGPVKEQIDSLISAFHAVSMFQLYQELNEQQP